MDRRSFLRRWGIGVAGLAAAGVAIRVFAYEELRDGYHWVGRQLDPDYEVKRAVAALRRHFPYLNFENSVAESYARDFFDRYTHEWEEQKKEFHLRFLLSADFFPGAEESNPLSYVGLYDPLSWCSNPFAKPAGVA